MKNKLTILILLLCISVTGISQILNMDMFISNSNYISVGEFEKFNKIKNKSYKEGSATVIELSTISDSCEKVTWVFINGKNMYCSILFKKGQSVNSLSLELGKPIKNDNIYTWNKVESSEIEIVFNSLVNNELLILYNTSEQVVDGERVLGSK